ncbi:F-box protein At2g39490-like [Cornus florida]|uniref:F-box protein At2g39490-like n=1 Tax=Cornus florida TaxID=4283 RepID=UPI002898DCA8|nr:F-box protein At2g39490-like [Cornus florida]
MESETLDLISSVPEDIINLIMSFLPLKEAVRTSVVSPLWRGIWTPYNVNLDIDSDGRRSHRANEGVTRVIDTFLKSYNNLELCKLCLRFEMKEKLIILAAKGVDKELHLNFSEENQVTSDFNLKLEVTCQSPANDFPELAAGFASLKTLHLRSVTGLAEDIVPALFSDFKFLECLKLEKCIGLRCLEINAGGSLKSLTVVDCPDLAEITLSASNLKSFSYQGVLPRIQLKNGVNLVDVMLDMRDGIGHNEFDCEELLSLLAALKDVQVLTLSGWLLEWLCSAGVIFSKLEFRFNMLKELCWTDSSIDAQKRASLAYFLDICPLLETLTINNDGTRKPITCPHFCHYWHEPYFHLDSSVPKSTSLQLQHLKVVKMAGYRNQEDELLVMDLLLKKAVILQSMTATSGQNDLWHVVRIPLSQLKQTARCQPEFRAILSPNEKYFFGFIK